MTDAELARLEAELMTLIARSEELCIQTEGLDQQYRRIAGRDLEHAGRHAARGTGKDQALYRDPRQPCQRGRRTHLAAPAAIRLRRPPGEIDCSEIVFEGRGIDAPAHFVSHAGNTSVLACVSFHRSLVFRSSYGIPVPRRRAWPGCPYRGASSGTGSRLPSLALELSLATTRLSERR